MCLLISTPGQALVVCVWSFLCADSGMRATPTYLPAMYTYTSRIRKGSPHVRPNALVFSDLAS